MTRWGIVGTGGMAVALYETISALPFSQVVAVASQSASRAEAFAKQRDITYAYASVEALAADPSVEAIYIASTNDRHHPDALACIEAGKAVLCEKPFALTRAQAMEMVAGARARGVFLMEAMWMRFQPAVFKLLELITAGTIGRVDLVNAGFSIPVPTDPSRRWFSAELGGGSLYDLGVYPLTLTYLLLGMPAQIKAVSVHTHTGVDAQTGMILAYPSGALAVLTSSMTADGGVEAVVGGGSGRIVVGQQFHHSTRLSVWRDEDKLAEHDVPDLGYRPEVEEVELRIGEGATESPIWSLVDSLALMELVDMVRTSARDGESSPIVRAD